MKIRCFPGYMAALSIVAVALVACGEDKTDPPASPKASSLQDSAITVHSREKWVAETFTLDNGMEVVVIPDRRSPVVTHMVWYRVGAADEPPGQSGIAHFLEHLMFKGTQKTGPGEFSHIVARNGGQDNAFTSQDYTAYFQRVAVDRLPMVMEMEADRMTGLRLDDDVVLPERDVVLEERRSRVENDPSRILGEQINATLYQAHPYGIPVIGWRHEIAQLDTEDALAFYRRYYRPANAVLVVSGDIDARTLLPMAQATYGQVPDDSSPVMTRERPGEPGPVAPRRVELEDARAAQPSWQRRYLAPSGIGSSDGPPLEVLAIVLGGSTTSRLYKALVVEQKIAVAAGAWYSGLSLDEGSFGLYAIPARGQTLQSLETAVDAEIAKLFQGGVNDEEVERAKTVLLAQSVYARDSQEDMARIFGSTLMSGGTVEDVLSWPARMRAVRPEAVVDAARSVLTVPNSVTGTLIPGGG